MDTLLSATERRMRTAATGLLACMLAALLAAPTVRAAEQEDPFGDSEAVGKVVALTGQATVTRSGEDDDSPLAIKDSVYIGDMIRTKTRSKLQIMFRDKTLIAVGQRARLTLDDFLFEPGDESSRCETSVAEGAFKVISGAIGKIAPDRVKVRTPTATIGIRGTTALGSAGAQRGKAVYMSGTAVSATNSYGQVILRGEPGTGCDLQAGQPPSQPRLFTSAEINAILSDMAFGGDGGGEGGGGGGGVPGLGDDGDGDDGGDGPDGTPPPSGALLNNAQKTSKDASQRKVVATFERNLGRASRTVTMAWQALDSGYAVGNFTDYEPRASYWGKRWHGPVDVTSTEVVGEGDDEEIVNVSRVSWLTIEDKLLDASGGIIAQRTSIRGRAKVEIPNLHRLDYGPHSADTANSMELIMDTWGLDEHGYLGPLWWKDNEGEWTIDDQTVCTTVDYATDNLGEFYLFNTNCACDPLSAQSADPIQVPAYGGEPAYEYPRYGFDLVGYTGVEPGDAPTGNDVYLYGSRRDDLIGAQASAATDFGQGLVHMDSADMGVGATTGAEIVPLVALDPDAGTAMAIFYAYDEDDGSGGDGTIADAYPAAILVGQINSAGELSFNLHSQNTPGPDDPAGDTGPDLLWYSTGTTPTDILGSVFGTEWQGLGFEGTGAQTAMGDSLSGDLAFSTGAFLNWTATDEMAAREELTAPRTYNGYASRVQFVYASPDDPPTGVLREISAGPEDVAIAVNPISKTVAAAFTFLSGDETYGSTPRLYLQPDLWYASYDDDEGFALAHPTLLNGSDLAPDLIFGQWSLQDGSSMMQPGQYSPFVAGTPTEETVVAGQSWTGLALGARGKVDGTYHERLNAGASRVQFEDFDGTLGFRGHVRDEEGLALFEGVETGGALEGAVTYVDWQPTGAADGVVGSFFEADGGPALAGAFNGTGNASIGASERLFTTGIYAALQTDDVTSYAHMHGNVLGLLDDDAAAYDANWQGPLTGVSEDGAITAKPYTTGMGWLDFTLPAVNPGGTYSGAADVSYGAATTESVRYVFYDQGGWREWDNDPVTVDLNEVHGALGEFAFFTMTQDEAQALSTRAEWRSPTEDLTRNYAQGDYHYRTFGYAGVRTSDYVRLGWEEFPTSGLWLYGGRGLGNVKMSRYLDYEVAPDRTLAYEQTGNLATAVNFTNQGLLGWTYVPGTGEVDKYFFDANISGGEDARFDALVFGQLEERGGDYLVWGGAAAGDTNKLLGHFFGHDVQALGFQGQGDTIDYVSLGGGTDNTWHTGGAAFASDPFYDTSTGTAIYQGYFAGLDQNLTGFGDGVPEVAYNETDAGLSLDVDLTYNTVDLLMTMTGGEAEVGDYDISTLEDVAEVGGGYVAVGLRTFLTLTDGQVTPTGATVAQGLDPANGACYLVTAPPEDQLPDCPWVVWGEWEATYVDNRTMDEHGFVRRLSHWVAGQESGDISGIADGVTGTYTGPSAGSYHRQGAGAERLFDRNGTALTVQFGAEPNVSGSLSMTGQTSGQHVLTVPQTAVSDFGKFNGSVSNWTIAGQGQTISGSSVNGSLYGPSDATTAPRGIGGNVVATHADTGQGTGILTGVFAGQTAEGQGVIGY